MLIFIILGIIILFAVLIAFCSRNAKDIENSNSITKAIRCPNCGSPAKVTGTHWECTWCGDYGTLK